MKIIPIAQFKNDQNKKDRYAQIILRKIIREEQRRKQNGNNLLNSRINDLISSHSFTVDITI